MHPPPSRLPPPIATACAAWLLSLGCVGAIGPSGGANATGAGQPGQGGQAASGAGGAGAASGGGAGTRTLAEIAAAYFPGQTATDLSKRVFRLTRTQLDVTTRALLPKLPAVTATAAATMPRDPLQTNYEYADNLNFNPANFTPFTNWVDAIAAGVKAAPDSVINCAPSGNASYSPSCLADQAKKFAERAGRCTTSVVEL